MFAKEFGWRPKVTAELEYWEEWLLLEGLNREYSEANPGSSETRRQVSLEELGIEVES